jgi:hypothetical protein
MNGGTVTQPPFVQWQIEFPECKLNAPSDGHGQGIPATKQYWFPPRHEQCIEEAQQSQQPGRLFSYQYCLTKV